MREINFLIIDDHKLLRDGIKTVLDFLGNKYRFIPLEAGTAEEGIEIVQSKPCDFVLVDYQLPKMNGGDAARAILKIKPGIKILGMSGFTEYFIFEYMRKCGVHGYVWKNIEPLELVHAIESVLEGNEYYSNEIWVKMKKQDAVVNESSLDKQVPVNPHLTKRENEILILCVQPYTDKEIADKLHISLRTVQKHRANLMKKLNVESRAHLLRYADFYKDDK